MSRKPLRPISSKAEQARLTRITRIARPLGFVGKIEYRHVRSFTGGAQYSRGIAVAHDLLTVYAEAFERDADPDDFSLEATLAHERAHQLIARHPKLTRHHRLLSLAGEEVLASVAGAIITPRRDDRDALLAKAIADLLNLGVGSDDALDKVSALWRLLKEIL